jgi:hypothetical protein
MKKEFKITFSGPDLQYTTDVSKELAAYIVGICMKGEENITENSPTPPQKTPPSVGSSPKESIAEYVHAKGPRRNPDKILAIAGYLVKNGSETFSPEDTKILFPKIGEPIPANFGRDFRWAVANAWISESHEGKNLFYITNTGKSVIDSNFSPEVIGKTKQKSRLKSSKKRDGKDTPQE